MISRARSRDSSSFFKGLGLGLETKTPRSTAWNSLPHHLHQISDTGLFKRRLKTELLEHTSLVVSAPGRSVNSAIEMTVLLLLLLLLLLVSSNFLEGLELGLELLGKSW